jgi:hypothetical protein
MPANVEAYFHDIKPLQNSQNLSDMQPAAGYWQE